MKENAFFVKLNYIAPPLETRNDQGILRYQAFLLPPIIRHIDENGLFATGGFHQKKGIGGVPEGIWKSVVTAKIWP